MFSTSFSTAFRSSREHLLRSGAICFGALLVIVGAARVALHFVALPAALLRPSPVSLELTDRRGATLREVRVDGRFSHRIQLQEAPENLRHAILAAEDKRFFEHGGIDWLAAGRAVAGNLTHHRVSSGASTITQQLVKLVQPRRRTVRTKLIEAVTALRLEQLWTKDRILVEYLNRLDFGNLNFGVAAAAHAYFGKPLADLTDAEAAFLAGLPKNPTRLNPYRALRNAENRQQVVLRRMRDDGWLAPDAYERARTEFLHLPPARRVFLAPHFVDLVLRDMEGTSGTVRTTLDLELQQIAERIVRDRLAPLRSQNVHDAAVVVLENATGNVLALVGSGDYFAPGAGQVDGAWARRSPGSALKPFTYLLAFEHGSTPATVIADVPAVFVTSTGSYQPENFTQRCNGPVRCRLALANSLNIPAVRALSSIGGAAPLRERLQQWGITTLDRTAEQLGLGLTIGNAEVRLLELTNAYAALARLGQFRPYHLTETPETHSPMPREMQPKPPVGPAWLIADILSDNEARVHSFGRESALHFEFPVACKTGTSTDFRDNWAIGYTPEFTVGVWAGNFEGAPMHRVSGVTGAAPILHDIFDNLHVRYGSSWYPRPPGIEEHIIQPLTGKLLVTADPNGVTEKFLSDNLPATESPSDYDFDGRVILGPEYKGWLASAQNSLGDEISTVGRAPELRVLTPVPGATFIIDPDVPSTGRIPLVAQGQGDLVWESDSLVCQQGGSEAYAAATQGKHKLKVHDAAGRQAETWIIVKAL